MSAGRVARSAARMMAVHGEAMVLKRVSEPTTVTLQGKRIPGTTEQIGGSAEQQRFRVKIGSAELDASAWASKVPTAAGDTLTVGGRARTVMDVRPLGDNGTVAIYELEVLG